MSTPFPEPGQQNWGSQLLQAFLDRLGGKASLVGGKVPDSQLPDRLGEVPLSATIRAEVDTALGPVLADPNEAAVTMLVEDPARAPRQVLDATYSDIGWAEGVIQKEDTIRRGKFGKIGTAGKAVVALRIDHQLDPYLAKVAPLFEARALPCGIGLVTQSVGKPTGGPTGYEPTNATWQDVHERVFYRGAEIWSHSRTHSNGPAGGFAGLESEIVGSAADLRAQGLLPMGFQQPGGPSNYGLPHTSAEGMDDTAGRLIRQTYPLYEAAVAGTTFRMLPTNGCRGLNHITVESITVQAVKDYIDKAIRFGFGLEIMCHPNQLDIPGLMSTAGFTAVLDYIVQKRDAGELEVLTPSGLAFADPTSTHRPSLVTGGKFPAATPTPEWTLGTATIQTDGGYEGPNYLRAAANVMATYNLLPINGFGVNGHVMYYRAKVRALTGGTWRARFIASTLGGSKYPFEKTGTLPASPDWKTVLIPFGVPLDTGNAYLAIGAAAGSTGAIDWDNVELVAA